MLSVKVQKDIGEYTEKIIGKMSIRTLACLAGGLSAAVAAAAVAHFGFGIEVADASLPVTCASIPFWLVGFYRPHGIKFEKFLPLWADFHLEDQRLLYRPTPVIDGMYQAVEPGKPSRKAKKAMRRKGAELDAHEQPESAETEEA